MLTRLEVDGFKNLLDVRVDFGPYTCIAGTNAVGKSNVFDAIQLLSFLADLPFMEAAQRVRGDGSYSSDPRTLFWGAGQGDPGRLTLAAEMIVPRDAEDDFGREVRPTTSFLRYELTLRYRPPAPGAGSRQGRITLESENLRHINRSEVPDRLPWRNSKSKFRDSVIFGRRSGTAYISTTPDDSGGVVNVHQDGGSRGKPRTSPASRAPRTVVSTTTTSDDPTILAARREMQQWRMLALEPSAMRAPDPAAGPNRIGADGAHLASALFRMANDSPDVYAEVAAAAAALTGVREVSVDLDTHRELLTLQARLGQGPVLPARALSDGTLRFLALCIINADPEFRGLICMEEPENGIHPGRMERMVDLLRRLAVDPTEQPGVDNPLRQVIVNTHSPYFVQLQAPDDVLFAEPVTMKDRSGNIVTSMRLLPLADTWRARKAAPTISRAAIVDYLSEPPNAQLRLLFDARPALHA